MELFTRKASDCGHWSHLYLHAHSIVFCVILYASQDCGWTCRKSWYATKDILVYSIHCPSSQGWSVRCPILQLFVWVVTVFLSNYGQCAIHMFVHVSCPSEFFYLSLAYILCIYKTFHVLAQWRCQCCATCIDNACSWVD